MSRATVFVLMAFALCKSKEKSWSNGCFSCVSGVNFIC